MSDKKSNGNNKKPQIAQEGYIPNNKNKRQGNQPKPPTKKPPKK